MKILVTGASGFIGGSLLSLLAKLDTGDKVYAVVRHVPEDAAPCVNWIVADLADDDWTKALPNEDFDIVIHLAQSKHYRAFPNHIDDVFNINVRATLGLAEWATKHRVRRFLLASTGNVYGFRNSAYSEEDRCVPETMYGASKLSAEILLRPFSEFMSVVVIRLFGVYGPGQTAAMLPGIVEQFSAGREITLAGNVGVRFNPIYVDDCTKMIRAITSMTGVSNYEVVNVGGSEVIDLRDVSEFLERFSGKKALIRTTPDQPKELVGSIAKLLRLCPALSFTPFSDGFRRTFEYQNDRSKAK